MEVIKVMIVDYGCTEMVILKTNLPGAMESDVNLSLKFEIASGKGKAYAQQHFPGVPIHEIPKS